MNAKTPSKAGLLALLGLAGGGALFFAAAYGRARWAAGTRALRARIEAGRATPGGASARYEPGATDADLPEPVRRYLRAVLKPGQPRIAAADIAHEGTFNAAASGPPRWTPFTSDQRVVTHRPGFDWDARVRVAPGLTAFVHDAYAAGEGVLRAELFGLLPVADVRGTPEAARGELMRFAAEAAWYPTCLLPGHGFRWEPADDSAARATLTDGDTEVTLEYRFGPDGLLDSVYSPARPRTVGKDLVPTPWEGRFWGYEERGGVLVPTEGEVAWLPPGAPPLPYWRGRVTRVAYEFEEEG